MIKKTGSLFNSEAPAIGHGCNTYGVMGAGIAKQFKERYPLMYKVYRALAKKDKFFGGGVFGWEWEDDFHIYNIFSQVAPGPNANLGYIQMGLITVAMDAESRGFETVAIPQIGCGIGGLNLPDVVDIIKSVEEMFDVEFELWTYGGTK